MLYYCHFNTPCSPPCFVRVQNLSKLLFRLQDCSSQLLLYLCQMNSECLKTDGLSDDYKVELFTLGSFNPQFKYTNVNFNNLKIISVSINLQFQKSIKPIQTFIVEAFSSNASINDQHKKLLKKNAERIFYKPTGLFS